MDLYEFYIELNYIILDYQELIIDFDIAKNKLDNLIETAKKSSLNINIDSSILENIENDYDDNYYL